MIVMKWKLLRLGPLQSQPFSSSMQVDLIQHCTFSSISIKITWIYSVLHVYLSPCLFSITIFCFLQYLIDYILSLVARDPNASLLGENPRSKTVFGKALKITPAFTLHSHHWIVSWLTLMCVLWHDSYDTNCWDQQLDYDTNYCARSRQWSTLWNVTICNTCKRKLL